MRSLRLAASRSRQKSAAMSPKCPSPITSMSMPATCSPGSTIATTVIAVNQARRRSRSREANIANIQAQIDSQREQIDQAKAQLDQAKAQLQFARRRRLAPRISSRRAPARFSASNRHSSDLAIPTGQHERGQGSADRPPSSASRCCKAQLKAPRSLANSRRRPSSIRPTSICNIPHVRRLNPAALSN